MFLSVSNSVMGSAYAEIGYSVNEKAYKAVSVYQTLDDAPASIQIPISAVAVPYISWFKEIKNEWLLSKHLFCSFIIFFL